MLVEHAQTLRSQRDYSLAKGERWAAAKEGIVGGSRSLVIGWGTSSLAGAAMPLLTRNKGIKGGDGHAKKIPTRCR